LLGLALGAWLMRRGGGWLVRPLPRVIQPLAVLGAWSLSFYMLHQPIFLGALMGGRALRWW
jgi:peptidoglycan/LPS O-acetylase OafA/YrhL